ncbi:MAG: ATPase [Flavobacteriia bacterium]|nr:MAG: ATPase [Flavobacteriia bacterium]
MADTQTFKDYINTGYTFKGDSITLGSAMLDGQTVTEAFVKIPLKTLNRHGLIAGATGTGKTKSLQVLAEHLSEKGIPVLLMDVKGDLSGLAKPSPGHPKIDERMEMIGLPFQSTGYPLEILTLSEQDGVRLRATVIEFGPVLLSRILDLTDVQTGIVSVLFKYCDDHGLPLLDLKDFQKVLHYATNEGKDEIQEEYGAISKASTGAILRKIVELEQQGGDRFFGERSFEVQDLTRLDEKGRGMINVLRLTDIQDKPKLFSTFMLQLLAEVYDTFPEQGDADQPELVIFIDEAHLVFEEASKTLMDQIETVVKLIRSKGVGVFFVTQNPKDVPEDVLAQLGLKIQHALRAFTAKDRKAIKLTAQNFPDTAYYDTEEVLTNLGTGEALVTVLDEKGRPTPLAATMMRAPQSRMDVLSDKELSDLLKQSQLMAKYSKTIDRESAYEILSDKVDRYHKKLEAQEEKEVRDKQQQKRQKTKTRRKSTKLSPVIKVLTSATFIRGVMGILSRALKK